MSKLKISAKLIISFMVLGMVPFMVIGLETINLSVTALEKQAYNQLESLRGVKKAQIENFFKARESDADVLVDMAGSLRSEALNKLTAVRQIKKTAIESYIQTITNQVETLSNNQMIIDGMRQLNSSEQRFMLENSIDDARIKEMRKELRTYYDGQFGKEYAKQNGSKPDIDSIMAKLSDRAVALQYYYIQTNKNPLGEKHKLDRADDGSTYSIIHSQIHPIIRDYLEKFGYYDIFLVDAKTGRIVYSVFKELDFNTSLLDGPWANTNFARAFKKARKYNPAKGKKKKPYLVDFKQYVPSYNAPASFIAAPIVDGGQTIGVLMFQMPLDKISKIMSERVGLGKTGETYLVGSDNLMRSDSYLDKKNRSVRASFSNPDKGRVDTYATRKALAGSKGAKVLTGYNGKPVLSSYTPVKFGGRTWALMAEIDVAEAFVPKVKGKKKDFYTDYVEKYGYYDLFLINPDGYVFYSVTREADFQTNMVSGKYKDSGLGKLTRKVLETKKTAISDIAPYAPSNGDPAGFIASPVVNHRTGDVELVVALQLSIDAINAIMGQRDGLGETGETYLVGPDKLMRSDSFLDPENHTVKASFANPDKGKVDTEATRDVLAGKTDQKIITDYNGELVLSSYTPVKVGDTTWGLIAEIDEAEALAAKNSLINTVLIIGLIGTAIIAAVGWYMAKSVSKPIAAMTGAMSKLADNHLDVEIPSRDRHDEIGEMAATVQVFKDKAIEVERLKAQQLENEKRAEEEKRAAMQAMADDFEKHVGHVVEAVSAAATQMQSSAGSMAATADQTNSQAANVASASEEASTNVQTVASAAEELSSSINEIKRQVEGSLSASDDAVAKAGHSKTTVQELVASAERIGEVVSLITDIAEQTNLLALNATIEAARAGEAGKGFAVVASEVKNLANQTAKATDEIGQQIATIQSVTGEAATSIEDIASSIQVVSENNSTVSTAVDEQSAATQEIARNVEQAAMGTAEVNANITGVTQAAGETGAAAGEILSAAGELSEQASILSAEVNKFLEQIRK